MMIRSLTIFIVLFAVIDQLHGRQSFRFDRRLLVQPTVGQPWPKPQTIHTTAQQFVIQPAAFHFLVDPTSQTCDLLTSALDRYYKLIFYPQTYLDYVLNQTSTKKDIPRKPKKSLADVPLLPRLTVRIDTACDQYPSLESNESCK